MTLLILILFPILLGAIYVFVSATCDLIEHKFYNHFAKTERYRRVFD